MDLSGCAVKLDHSVGTPDSIPNMRSDIFGLDVTDLFGLDFTELFGLDLDIDRKK